MPASPSFRQGITHYNYIVLTILNPKLNLRVEYYGVLLLLLQIQLDLTNLNSEKEPSANKCMSNSCHIVF